MRTKPGIALIVGIVLAVSLPALSQGGVSTVIVTAPRVIMRVGEQMSLQATAWDSLGNVTSGKFDFATSDPTILGTDSSGVVTATGIGIARVNSSVGQVESPPVWIQVLPERIEVKPAISEMYVGERIQFEAVARDIHGEIIPNVSFRWRVTAANGLKTRTASVSDDGLFWSSGIGLMTVRAAIDFTEIGPAHVASFEGLAQVSIRTRPEYRLSRLLATDPVEREFQLRPAFNSDIAVNEAGQVAFVANFGLTSALILFEKDHYTVLASSGAPGFYPGSIFWHFDGPPGINNNGEVLIRASAPTGSPALLLASKAEVRVVADSSVWPARNSLNDAGDFVVFSQFPIPESTDLKSGLFASTSNGRFSPVWTDLQSLKGFETGFTFDRAQFGLDNKKLVY